MHEQKMLLVLNCFLTELIDTGALTKTSEWELVGRRLCFLQLLMWSLPGCLCFQLLRCCQAAAALCCIATASASPCASASKLSAPAFWSASLKEASSGPC